MRKLSASPAGQFAWSLALNGPLDPYTYNSFQILFELLFLISGILI